MSLPALLIPGKYHNACTSREVSICYDKQEPRVEMWGFEVLKQTLAVLMVFSGCARSTVAEGIKRWPASRYSGSGSALTLMSRHTSSWKTSGDQERSYCLQLLFTSLYFPTSYRSLRSSSKTANIIISLTVSVKKTPHWVQVVVLVCFFYFPLTCPKGPDPMRSSGGRSEREKTSSSGSRWGNEQGLPAAQRGISTPRRLPFFGQAMKLPRFLHA